MLISDVRTYILLHILQYQLAKTEIIAVKCNDIDIDWIVSSGSGYIGKVSSDDFL